MTLGKLITACRGQAGDKAKPYLWNDEDWTLYLNEAIKEACVRASLILGDSIEIQIEAGATRYDLPLNVLDVITIKVDGVAIGGWDLTPTQLVLSKALDQGVMTLEVVRLPKPLEADGDVPEMHSMHHYRLIDWALRCAYLKQDADTFDAKAAAGYEAAFIRSFGAYDTANVQRKHRRKYLRTTRPIKF